MCFTYAVVTILFLFLSRVNRAFTQFFVRKVYVNYIKFKNGGNIDEIARSTGNKLVGKRETISRRWEIRSIRYWAVSVNDKVKSYTVVY